MGTGPSTATLTLFELTMGATITQAIRIAAEAKIADVIYQEPAGAADVAGRTGLPLDAATRIMRVLERLGVVAQDRLGRYLLTAFGDPLREDAVPSLRSWALMAGSPWFWGPVGRIGDVFTEHRSGFELEYDQDVFEFLNEPGRTEAQAEYDAAMGGAIVAETRALADDPIVARAGLIVDVGGGGGAMAHSLLREHTLLRAVVFDQPAVVERAEASVPPDVADRCDYVAGSFFDGVPAGGDVYLLTRILHDWRDDRAAEILRSCRAAMDADGRLIVVDLLITEDDARPFATLCDLNMAALYDARERTPEAMAELFAQAGFTLTRADRTAAGRYIIEGAPDASWAGANNV